MVTRVSVDDTAHGPEGDVGRRGIRKGVPLTEHRRIQDVEEPEGRACCRFSIDIGDTYHRSSDAVEVILRA